MNINHGKYLGVDYGDKRTGIADCDISGLVATGIATVSEGGMRNTAIRVAKEAEGRGCKNQGGLCQINRERHRNRGSCRRWTQLLHNRCG